MKNNYEIKDILSAVDSLLYSNKKEEPQSINVIDKPLMMRLKRKIKKTIKYQKILKKLFYKLKNF